MWLKILCVAVIASNVLAKDALLDTLYGVQNRNKMAICVSSPSARWRRCDGALYNQEWVVARARCLAAAPRHRMTALRLDAGGSCDDIAAGEFTYTSITIQFLEKIYMTRLARCLSNRLQYYVSRA